MANQKAQRVVRAAVAQIGVTMLYDPAYVSLAYPMGDVPMVRGVCTDVVVRAFRTGAGADLQKMVHEDVVRARGAYNIRRADRNIDHRRVLHLMTFFRRQGRAILPLSRRASDYQSGDVVAWRLPNGRLHIGVVAENGRAAPGSPNPSVVHNIGAGTQREDVLFAWPVIGHYRYFR